MKIKLTQKQHDFIQTFGSLENEINKKRALYNISRWGFAHPLTDGNNKTVGFLDISEQLKMIEAVIYGYDIKVVKFVFYNFADGSGATPLYYAGKLERLKINKRDAKEVVKDSEEYEALVESGFMKEEV